MFHLVIRLESRGKISIPRRFPSEPEAAARSPKAVDPSGQFADGRSFKDVDEFKRLLLADPDAIARGFASKLLVYATGANLQFADRVAVEEIVARARSKGYGTRTLLHEVIQSALFRTK